MAEIFPDEGLDIVLGQWPLAATRLSTTYACLFTSQSPTTVITAGQALANVTETSYTSYARQAMAAATWGAAGAGSGGRKSTYPQITFPTVGATGATINGFFIGDATPPTKVVAQANFDSGIARVVVTGDVLKLTPAVTFQN